MHKTPKAESCRPPRGSLGAQQRAFNAFRRLYNEERPHTALGGHPPAVATSCLRAPTPSACRRWSTRGTSS